MILNDYDKLINEHFDLMDSATRRCVAGLNEDAEQSQMLSALSSALYDKIVSKVDDIDFGSIPRSRGDITKVDGFENTVECLNIMKRLVTEYKQDPAPVDVVLTAIENVKSRRALFMKAYAMNVEMPMLVYNLTVASIENSVSFLISVCIQYIKDPETGDLGAAIDKTAYNNVKSNMIYEQLASFNAACASGMLDETLNGVINGSVKFAEACEAIDDFNNGVDQPKDIDSEFQEPINDDGPEYNVEPNPYAVNPGDDIPGQDQECVNCGKDVATNEFFGSVAAGIGTGLAVGAVATAVTLKSYKFLITVLIPMLRNMAYFFVNLRMSIKDYIATQAQFIEMNAYKLQDSDRYEADPKKMKKVVAKQLKIANAMKKISGKFDTKTKTATKKTETDVKKEVSTKVKVNDLKDDLPADVYDKSLIF